MRIVGIALLLLPLLIHAETVPLRPHDFAYGMTLQGDGEGALFTFALPEEVYRYSVRADQGDMRIFNSSGEVVPHLLQHDTVSEEIHQTVLLPFYPVYADEIGTRNETMLRIFPNQQGTVIDLRARTAEEMSNKTISYYILDASALEQPIRRLTLQWQAGSETFISTVMLEHGSDLGHWRALASASLAELLYGSDRLQRNEILLPVEQEPYLRLHWPPGARGVRLSAVAAEVAQPGAAVVLNWSSAESRASDGTPGRYAFEVNGHYPVERVQVVLPQENTMVRAQLMSSADAQGSQWTVRYQGVLYVLLHEGLRIGSGELPISATSDRHWRLDVAQEGGGIGAGLPELKLGWYPHRAVFLARGSGPFTLAFGSARAAWPLQDQGLAGWLTARRSEGGNGLQLKPVVVQPMHTLGGEQQLHPAAPPWPWKKWLLWAVLVAGVLAMLGMARGLYRQMNRG